jgi:multidrug resistance efflux pump
MAEHEHEHKETAEKKATSPARKRAITWIVIGVVVLVALGVGGYLYVSSKTIYIDDSEVTAPIIALSPENSGVLEAVFVNAGDEVAANTPVARVGDEIVETKTAGQIVTVNNNVGEYINVLTGDTVASMVDPTQLRVVGNLDENKGLSDIQVGDPATFTVDAFGSKVYKGVVDEVSPTSEQSDVVFNISDARPTNEFAIYVRFDPTLYPELKNGMSARIWIYRQ